MELARRPGSISAEDAAAEIGLHVAASAVVTVPGTVVPHFPIFDMALRHQARLPLVVLACILAGPGSAIFSIAPAGAAVAVIVNACDGEAVVTTEPVWGSARTQRVAPNATASLFLPQAVSARVTVGATTAEVTLHPWEIHTLRWKEGSLQVENALTARAQPPLWSAPAILAEPPRQVIIPVAVYADDAQPARQSVWEPRLRAQVAAVSEVLTATCGVGLQVTTVGTWDSPGDESIAREARETDFRAKTFSDSARVIVGFSSRLQSPFSAAMRHAPRTPLASHILIPDVHPGLTPQEQWWLLLHEFAHWLGAFDLSEGVSVMNAAVPPSEYAAKGAAVPWDAANLLILNLTADELRYRGVRNAEAFSSGTRDYLLALYRRAGMDGRGGADALRLAKFFLRPGLPDARYLAVFEDGTTVGGDEISGWGPGGGSPQLGGKAFFDPADPALWVRQRQDDAAPVPGPGIEFFGGDRLPGRVLRVVPAGVVAGRSLPTCLEVLPRTAIGSPTAATSPGLLVTTNWLQRVVLRPLDVPYQPGTVFADDGRQISFRALQWSAEGIRLLTDQGVVRLDLQALAEIHLPRSDIWDALPAQWAVVAPEGEDILMRLELAEGASVTTSRRFFTATQPGDQPEQGYHVVLPAWSVQPLWIPYRSIRAWRFFSPCRVPLTHLPIEEYAEQPKLGGYWGPSIDRNLAGGPPAVGDRLFGWGVSLTAPARIAFPLPPVPVAFQSWFGLDRTAGDGGSARVGVAWAGDSQRTLFRSDLLIGSRTLGATGRLELGGEAGSRLVLFTEDAEQERPPAADLWNVRDCVDWGEPLLFLDPPWMQRELRRRWASAIAAWNGWQVGGDRENPGWTLETYADLEDARRPRFGWVTTLSDQPLVLSRRLMIPADAAELQVRARTVPPSPRVRVRLEADGDLLGEAPLPGRGNRETPEAITAPLTALRGRAVSLRIECAAAEPGARVEWYAISIQAEEDDAAGSEDADRR